MKFCHDFIKIASGDSFAQYRCGRTNARIDIVSGSAIRVAIYKDEEYIIPTFNINPLNELTRDGRSRLSTVGFNPSGRIDGNEIMLECGIKASVEPHNFVITYTKDGERIFGDRAPLGYNFEKEFGDNICHYITRDVNEKIYGLGDKTGRLNKARNSYKIETTDCMGYDASSADPMYKHIPFYICDSEAGTYGIFYDTSATSQIDLGREHNNYYEPYKVFSTEDNCLIYYVFFGTKLEIIKEFGKLCGKQAFPPRWSFDYCASTMAYTDAPKSEEKMNAFLDKIKELGLSCQGFYLSSGYTSIGNQRCVFNWNTDKFPDPAKFIKNFADNGIKIIPNIKPAFLTGHPMYDMIKENGWFVKNPDGTPFITQFWDGYGSYLDFTNDDAFEFWSKQVKEKLLDYGIICTWNDNNEFDIKDSEAIASGFGTMVRANQIRPTLTYLMDLASYEAQIGAMPDKRPFLSTRSGGIGARRLAQTWSGDNRSAFEDLRYCHYIGLTMSMSGLHFYGHDLGGFSGDMPSRELLLRWLQHGIFEPRFTIHSWNADGSATMPWSYDDIIDSVKALFKQRRKLVPYLYNCAYNSVENEDPINSPLFLYYDDEEINEDGNSFMVGRDILATCVFDEGESKVKAYLPRKDDWYLGNKLYDGGQEVELNIKATDEMPYFVRSGSVIATDEGECEYGSEERIVLTIYPIKNGRFTAQYFCDDGESYGYKDNDCILLKFDIECDEDTVTVSYTNESKVDYNPTIKLCDNRKLIIKE